jgi:hypothetical protein
MLTAEQDRFIEARLAFLYADYFGQVTLSHRAELAKARVEVQKDRYRYKEAVMHSDLIWQREAALRH